MSSPSGNGTNGNRDGDWSTALKPSNRKKSTATASAADAAAVEAAAAAAGVASAGMAGAPASSSFRPDMVSSDKLRRKKSNVSAWVMRLAGCVVIERWLGTWVRVWLPGE
jgi:hypothetical protein